jgi:hypothetical protein
MTLTEISSTFARVGSFLLSLAWLSNAATLQSSARYFFYLLMQLHLLNKIMRVQMSQERARKNEERPVPY